jgi:hypothetical protein
MGKSSHNARLAWGTVIGCFVAFAGACEAEPEFACFGGDGPCPLVETGSASTTTGPGTGSGSGGQGGAGGMGLCLESCDTTKASGNTGEYPCAVDKVIDNCRRCHTPELLAMSGAPFSLDSYEDSQQLFFDVAIWARMKSAIEGDFMPQIPPKLSSSEKQSVIEEWICNCAPPRASDEVCD